MARHTPPLLGRVYHENEFYYIFSANKILAKLEGMSKKGKPVAEKVVVLGPGSFGLKQDFSDGSAQIHDSLTTVDLPKEKNIPNKKRNIKRNDAARSLRENINLVVGEIGNNNDGVTDDLSFETGTCNSEFIEDVGDLNQLYSNLWTGPAGCSPTSAANIMVYWENHGYSGLVGDLTDEELEYELRLAMGTYYDSLANAGKTDINDISPGMQSFARDRGLDDATAGWIEFPEWSDYRYAITNYGPNIISFDDQTYYGDHSVTGVGWIKFTYNFSSDGHRYMIVHDNRYGTAEDVYIASERDYSALYLDLFYPEGDN